MQCEAHDVHSIGDHHVWYGKVRGVGGREERREGGGEIDQRTLVPFIPQVIRSEVQTALAPLLYYAK